MVDATRLRTQSDPNIDAPLTAWRQFRESGRTSGPAGCPADLVDMARSVDSLFGWTDEKARRARPGTVAGEPASAGGVAGLYMLAKKAGESAIDFSDASRLAGELAIGDDDIAFLLAYTGKSSHGDGQTAGAMMQLAAMNMQDDAVAAKLYRSLAAISREGAYQWQCYQSAETRLADGADDALRAEIWNEMSILLSSTGDFDKGRALAEAAHDLAVQSGASQIASMALGNLAWTLMQQGRFAEALTAFEQLEKDQEAAGDQSNLEKTRQNIAICHRNLKNA